MKYTTPTVKTTGITPRDQSCIGTTFNCVNVWHCDGVWSCNKPDWNGCKNSYV